MSTKTFADIARQVKEHSYYGKLAIRDLRREVWPEVIALYEAIPRHVTGCECRPLCRALVALDRAARNAVGGGDGEAWPKDRPITKPGVPPQYE